MAVEFRAIMRGVLNKQNDWVRDFAALVRLGTFVIQHYEVLLRWMDEHDEREDEDNVSLA